MKDGKLWVEIHNQTRLKRWRFESSITKQKPCNQRPKLTPFSSLGTLKSFTLYLKACRKLACPFVTNF